jgi:hypothetical protein
MPGGVGLHLPARDDDAEARGQRRISPARQTRQSDGAGCSSCQSQALTSHRASGRGTGAVPLAHRVGSPLSHRSSRARCLCDQPNTRKASFGRSVRPDHGWRPALWASALPPDKSPERRPVMSSQAYGAREGAAAQPGGASGWLASDAAARFHIHRRSLPPGSNGRG